jgi:hypothetical protein
MLDKIIATFCILDDLLHILHQRDDPQAKITDSEILTIAIVACQEFGGNIRKALQWVIALLLFSFVPSESRSAAGSIVSCPVCTFCCRVVFTR